MNVKKLMKVIDRKPIIVYTQSLFRCIEFAGECLNIVYPYIKAGRTAQRKGSMLLCSNMLSLFREFFKLSFESFLD